MAGLSPNNLPTFEKLKDESNYAIWKFQMEVYLIDNGLWKYTSKTPEDNEFEQQQDQQARAKICLMVEKDCLIYLRHVNTARDAWEALRTAYQDSELSNSTRLLAKLVNLKLRQFKNMRQYVNEVMMSAQKLKDAGKEVDDEFLATILLNGLPEEYFSVRLAIENSNDVLTTEYVRNKLLNLEERSTSRDEDDFDFVDSSKIKKRSSRNQLVKCRICVGNHDVRDCPELSGSQSIRVSSDRQRYTRLKRGGYGTGFYTRPSANYLMDSDDHTAMMERKDFPCFLMFARMAVWCITKVFRLW